MLDPLRRLLHDGLRRVQVVAGRDNGNQQQKQEGKRKVGTPIDTPVAGRLMAPHKDHERPDGQSDPDQIKQQFHKSEASSLPSARSYGQHRRAASARIHGIFKLEIGN